MRWSPTLSQTCISWRFPYLHSSLSVSLALMKRENELTWRNPRRRHQSLLVIRLVIGGHLVVYVLGCCRRWGRERFGSIVVWYASYPISLVFSTERWWQLDIPWTSISMSTGSDFEVERAVYSILFCTTTTSVLFFKSIIAVLTRCVLDAKPCWVLYVGV